MSLLLKALIAPLVFLLAALPARAADPLASVEWVKANLGKPGIVLLDVRSGAGRTKADYLGIYLCTAILCMFKRF